MNDSMIEATAKKKSHKGIWISLLVLVLLSGAGFYGWQYYAAITAKHNAQLLQLQQDVARLQSNSREQDQQLDAIRKHTQTLQDMAQQALDIGNRHQKGWLLAEADYLMRIASHRLQISHDINGAIAALQSADQGLFETGDITLLPVRQQLAKDVAALKALHQADIDGIVLALDQMSDQIASLPYKPADEELKQQLPDEVASDTSTPGIADKIFDAIKALGNIKIHRGRAQRASDEQQQYQGMHLLLSHLSSARLAALRLDTKQFVYDLGIAQQLLNRYYDLRDNRVIQMNKDLNKYLLIKLSPNLPDISASWTRLQTARNKIVREQ